jgi:acetoacetyl-CoA synthetase
MKEGYALTDPLCDEIKNAIKLNASPRHVPAKILQIADIPYTLNMKKVELAVQKIIHGREVKNKDALKNPEALDCFAGIPELSS